MEVYMDNQVINNDYYSYNNCFEVSDKLKYLKTVKANLLVRTHIKYIIGNLYIIIDGVKRGYVNEMIIDNALTDYSNEATSSIIVFFNDDAQISRGILVDDNSCRLKHSWIEFNLHGKSYVFDPSFKLIVPKDTYDGIFLPESFGSISAKKVKDKLLTILATGQKDLDQWISVNGSDDVNSPFYKTNMQIKGEEIGGKILTLTTKYNHK